MDELRRVLRSLVQETLRKFSGVQIPTRPWLRILRMDNGGMEIRSIQRPDARMLIGDVRRICEELSQFRQLVKLVQSSPVLAANLLTTRYGESLPEAYPVGEWLYNTLIWPFVAGCMTRISSPELDDAAFDSLFQQLVADLESHTVQVTRLYPLLGLRLSQSEVRIDHGLRLRRIPPEEMESWLNPDWGAGDHPLMRFHLGQIRCAVEESLDVPRPMPKEAALEPDRVSALVDLLRIVTGARVQVAFVEEEYHSLLWRSSRGRWPDMLILKDIQPATLTEDDGHRVALLWRRLDDSPNAAKLAFALRRCGAASDRLRDEDKLIDYWIALESIFVPELNLEVGFRASMRIAAFLGQEPEDRLRVYEDMTHSYAWRSALVHGAVNRQRQLAKKCGLEDTVKRTRACLEKAIWRILELQDALEASDLEKTLFESNSLRMDHR